MDEHHSQMVKKPATIKNDEKSPAFFIMIALLLIVTTASVIFLIRYRPAPAAPAPQITFEQKMAYLEKGEPLPQQEAKPVIPWWMMAMVLGFAVAQILPLVIASHKGRASEFTRRELRQIEFLVETPLHLGLLGSLLGVSMTQFISGSLAAPLAYLTTITGILLYLFGRFTILVTLPAASELS
jgi:hypothetical protein